MSKDASPAPPSKARRTEARTVILSAARTYAVKLRVDEGERRERLRRSLWVYGIAWREEYAAQMERERERLMDAEIAETLQIAQADEEVSMLLLMAAL